MTTTTDTEEISEWTLKRFNSPPYRARGYSVSHITTVACKTRRGIYRAITHGGYSPETLIDAILRHVGTLDPTVEWTGYRYSSPPAYAVADYDTLRKAMLPSGVYLFPTVDWRWQTFGDPVLVDKPRGW